MQAWSLFQGSDRTLSAHLYPSESILLSQDGLGLYDGKDKSALHQDGKLILTTHRLIYLHAFSKDPRAFVQLALSSVKQTEFWAGFLKSSAKITLNLSSTTCSTPAVQSSGRASTDGNRPSTPTTTAAAPTDEWICRVCGMSNVAVKACSVCGVQRDKSQNSVLPSSASKSEQSTRPSTPAPAPPITTTDPNDKRISCPRCTFLNHHSMMRCEVCDAPLPSLESSSTPARPSTPSSTTAPTFVRLSFRQGGEKAFYTALKSALSAKKWDGDPTPSRSRSLRDDKGGGLEGLLRGMDAETREQADDLSSALQDLDALMAKAKEMIVMAQTLSAKVQAKKEATGTDENADELALASQSLLSLGVISAPVTSETAASEAAFRDALLRELVEFLQTRDDSFVRVGYVALDQLWCEWNRARGVSLVSPSDLRSCARRLKTAQVAIEARKVRPYFLEFSSVSGSGGSLALVHTSRYSVRNVSARILESLDERQALALSYLESALTLDPTSNEEGQTTTATAAVMTKQGMSALEIARQEGMSIELAQAYAAEIESALGTIVRDDQAGLEGTRWYRNWISSTALDDGM